jgi:hypothetical protein
MPQLDLQFGADIAPLIKTMADLQNDLSNFKSSLQTATEPATVDDLNQRLQDTERQIQRIKEEGSFLPEQSAPIVNEINSRLRDTESEIRRIRNVGPLTPDNAYKNVDKVNASLKNTEASLKRIKNQGSVLPGNTANETDRAANSLLNVGRIMQDLPFGFIAIENNLNPLLESFQRLKAETGSTSSALMAMLKGLGGGAGLGLALSAFTAIMGFSTIGLSMWERGTHGATGAADELAKSIRDLNEVQGEGAASVAGDLAKVNALAATASNVNTSYAERKRALQELREVNKNYFGDLKEEDILTGKLASTVQEYTKALVNSAITKEFSSEIAKVAKEVADSDAEIIKAHTKLEKAQQAVNDIENDMKTGGNEEYMTGLATNLSIAKKGVADAEKEVQDQSEKSTKLLEQQALLTDRLNRSVAEGLKYKDLDRETTKKGTDALKARLDELERIKNLTVDATKLRELQELIFDVQVKIAVRDQKKNHISKEELDLMLLGYQHELQKAFDNEALSLEAIPKVKFSLAEITALPGDISDVIAKATGKEKFDATLHNLRLHLWDPKTVQIMDDKDAINKKLTDEINSTFSNLKIDALSNIGETLGNALAGGKDFGKALADGARQMINIVGSVMVQLGKYIISAAIQIQALKKLVQNFAIKNPALAIAGGIALIAAGTAIKNANINIPALAEGGITTGPTIALIGEAGREAVIPLAKLPGLIQGQKDQQQLNVTVGLGIKDRDLIAFIERGQIKYNRMK